MRIKLLALACAMAVWPGLALASDHPAPSTPSASLNLAQALNLAETANPELRRSAARASAIEGGLRDARALLFNNPQFSTERTRREVPQASQGAERRREWALGLSQTLEIAGQRGHRLAEAEAGAIVFRADHERLRREVRAQAAAQFYRVLALQQQLALERQASALFERTATAIEKRRAAGEDTKLDANVANVELARAQGQVDAVREQLIEARTALTAMLQLPPERLFEAEGRLDQGLDDALPETGELLANLSSQPGQRALAAQEEMARSRLALERASRFPDLTVGLSTGREGSSEARERVTTLSVSFPLPLFKRNAAAIGLAGSAQSQAIIDREAGQRNDEAEIRAQRARLESLQLRARRQSASIAPLLADNETLSLRSMKAGQIGLLELIQVSRQVFDAHREQIATLLDFQATRLSLARIAGQPLNTEGRTE